MPETVELITRALPLRPESIDPEKRTVEVIFSTGASVRRFDMNGPFEERLSMDPKAAHVDQLAGAPLLNAHRRYDLANVIGVVEAASMDGKRGVAKVRFSERAEVEPIWRDVQSGILRQVSIGYAIHKAEETRGEDGRRIRTATDYTIGEISLVPISADPGAHVREGGDMPDDVKTPDPPETATRAEPEKVREMAKIAGVADAVADDLIEREASEDCARKAIFDAMAERSGPDLQTEQTVIEIGASGDDPNVRNRWMGEALFARVAPTHELSAPARQFANLSLVDIARETLRQRGVPMTGMPMAEIVTRALHTSSDFSVILGDTVGRTMRQAYDAAPSGVKRMARQTTARDFRAKTRVQLGEAPTLEKVNEHGEFTRGTMADAKEAYAIDTFGRVVGITRKALINDDLGAFTPLSTTLGRAAAEFEAQFLVDLLEKNSGAGPTMDDGDPVFHANHKNLAASGAAINSTPLGDARLAMRKQTGLSGQLINVVPRYILVPAELENTVEQALSAIYPTTIADVNPFAERLMPIVEPRLADPDAWYVVSDTVEGLEYAYLEGAPGPQTESRSGFDVDGVEIKVRLDFGAGFVDWRAWYRNPGA